MEETDGMEHAGRSRKLKDLLNEGKATGRVGRQPAFLF